MNTVVDKPSNSEITDNLIMNGDNQEINGDGNLFFGNILYLGTMPTCQPKDEHKIAACANALSAQVNVAFAVTLSISDKGSGCIMLLSEKSKEEIISFTLSHVTHCVETPQAEEKVGFAFVFAYCGHGPRFTGDVQYQCHAFQCKNTEDRLMITNRIRCAIKGKPLRSKAFVPTDDLSTLVISGLNLTVDIRETDSKGSFSSVPKEKGNVFKLRCNVDKEVVFTVQQSSEFAQLKIDRCLGIFIGNIRAFDVGGVNLLEISSVELGADNKQLTVVADWTPVDEGFEALNTVSEYQVVMTIGVHLLIQAIEMPVDLRCECRAKIFPQQERCRTLVLKPITEECFLYLEEALDEATRIASGHYNLKKIDYLSELKIRPSSTSSTETSPPSPSGGSVGDIEEDDEPIISGTGVVSMEITDEQVVEAWSEVLIRWHADLEGPRPRRVTQLTRKGVPAALRAEAWPLMARCYRQERELLDAYRILIDKDGPQDSTINRDIHRTFPRHEFFLEKAGEGQNSLFRVCSAYSMYDDELGYCQGLSYVAATLLLHMPEEQAFSLLVKILFDYGVRDLFLENFAGLHLRNYQMERYLQQNMSDLSEHFSKLNIEMHMFSSQWFLTLFTSKFELYVVGRIMDAFLSEGMVVIVRIGIALLKLARKELLRMDFEGILKYFRVAMPKRYRSEADCKELMDAAASIKVNVDKYTKEWQAMQQSLAQREDPRVSLSKELRSAQEEYTRLERENTELAEELLDTKTGLQESIEQPHDQSQILEDKNEIVLDELYQTRKELTLALEEKKLFERQANQVLSMLRQEAVRQDEVLSQQERVIEEYRRITTHLLDHPVPDGGHSNQVDQMRSLVKTLEGEVESAKTAFAAVKSQRQMDLLPADTSTQLNQSTGHKDKPCKFVQGDWFRRTFNSLRDLKPSRREGSQGRQVSPSPLPPLSTSSGV